MKKSFIEFNSDDLREIEHYINEIKKINFFKDYL